MIKCDVDGLFGLLLSIERGEPLDYLFDCKSTSDSDSSKFFCNVTQGGENIGYMNYRLDNLFEPKLSPSVNISIINSDVSNCRLATYLMTRFFITNASNLPRNSEIQFNGVNERRRGDLNSILMESSKAVDTFGGSKSRYLHFNFGFRPSLRLDTIDNLLVSLECFDTSADLVSDCNDNDSYFSKVVTMQINSWFMNDSMKGNLLLSNAYYDFINSLDFVKEYARLDSMIIPDNYSGKVSRMKIELDKAWLKRAFLSKYKSLYSTTMDGFMDLRMELKSELVNDYNNYITHLKSKLHSLIVPFSQEVYDKYVNDVMNSRGIKEITYLIDGFKPEQAGIPLPSIERMTKSFDILVGYVKKQLF